ncbi:MAG TPA: OmpA family protein [Polyangiaceae bacterium]|jgi:OOP family OmpA-OmpF porin|nr:OmpA family protein [Polyangiaceae bacterium]
MFRQASLNAAKWPLKFYPATSSVALGLALLALGCGGTTTFQDTTPIKIAVAPPAPPPPAPPPPEPPKQVKIRDNRIELGQKIQFALNKSEILPASFGLMDELAKTIQENPQVQKVSIEGHASNEGQAQYNLALSKARAEAVRAYLVSKGVSADRLSSTGFGASKPIASNDNEEGREKNRRVEFHITKQQVTKEKVEVDSSGKEKVIEKTSANEEAPQ